MKLRRARAAAPFALALCAALAACAASPSDAYLRAFAAGARALHAGRYAEAARAYADAAERATRLKDRDEARLLEARCYQRAGRVDDAEAAYHRLAEAKPEGPRAARAMFELGEIAIARGDAARGYALLEATARRFPNHGVTRPVIHRIAAHIEDERGPEAAIAWLRTAAPAFRGTDQEQKIEYEIALALDRMGKRAEAHDALLATARAHPYPFGSLTDDALFRAAEIDSERGQHREAIEHLRELLAPREKADAPASYDRPRFVVAQMRIAEIYRDELHDREAAIREFEKMYTSYPDSTKRDDALFAAALLAREAGDEARACRLITKLTTDLPESRYAPCARRICKSAPEGKRACAGYIERRIEGDERAEDE